MCSFSSRLTIWARKRPAQRPGSYTYHHQIHSPGHLLSCRSVCCQGISADAVSTNVKHAARISHRRPLTSCADCSRCINPQTLCNTLRRCWRQSMPSRTQRHSQRWRKTRHGGGTVRCGIPVGVSILPHRLCCPCRRSLQCRSCAFVVLWCRVIEGSDCQTTDYDSHMGLQRWVLWNMPCLPVPHSPSSSGMLSR